MASYTHTMPTSTCHSLTDFTAYELPTKKWMNLISPTVRLRVRGKRRDFVSPVVKVDNRRPGTETELSPSFADDEVFEVVIEKKKLLSYKRIMRTRSVTIKEVRTSDRDPCTLSLYDGRYSTGELDGRIEIGRVTFLLSRA
ncbi:hypothetical protein V8E55_004923 [Tylopilus felleus]